MPDLHHSLPFIRSVLHPSDFSEASRNAFAHALAISLRRMTDLTLLHVDSGEGANDVWTGFPPVRSTLERWGMLEPGSERSDVFDRLGVSVRKVSLRDGNVLDAVLKYLQQEPTDLIVLTTEGREGLPRWIRGSLAASVARDSKTMTLFVPAAGRGFVSPDDGSLTLNKILVPVDGDPSPRPAVAYAARAGALVENPVEISLLHVGSEAGMPSVETPEVPGCSWKRIVREGSVIETIAEVVREEETDLVVMSTAGRQGILDALRGSVTEQVVRQCGRPLLAVPTTR